MLIEADNERSGSEDVRLQALENLATEELSSLEAELERRGPQIIERLLAAPVDENFTQEKVNKKTEEKASRCFPGRIETSTTREAIRDISVPGLGEITVSRIHTKFQEKFEEGSEITAARKNDFDYSVTYKRPDPIASVMVTAIAQGEDERFRWDVDEIASFHLDDYNGPVNPNASIIGSMAESVDSFESIAEALNVEIPNGTLV